MVSHETHNLIFYVRLVAPPQWGCGVTVAQQVVALLVQVQVLTIPHGLSVAQIKEQPIVFAPG
jgi:hypothetical protein